MSETTPQKTFDLQNWEQLLRDQNCLVFDGRDLSLPPQTLPTDSSEPLFGTNQPLSAFQTDGPTICVVFLGDLELSGIVLNQGLIVKDQFLLVTSAHRDFSRMRPSLAGRNLKFQFEETVFSLDLANDADFRFNWPTLLASSECRVIDGSRIFNEGFPTLVPRESGELLFEAAAPKELLSDSSVVCLIYLGELPFKGEDPDKGFAFLKRFLLISTKAEEFPDHARLKFKKATLWDS